MKRLFPPPWVLVLLLCLFAAGCMVDLNAFELCDRDPEACSVAAGALPKLDGCTSKDALKVEVGTGETDFETLGSGAPLKMHLGTPLQAPDLRHVFVGVRIHNPDPVGGRFRATFRLTEPKKGQAGRANAETETTEVRVVMQKTLKKAADGSLSRGGLRMFVYEAPIRAEVTVDDQCGRVATHVHAVK